VALVAAYLIDGWRLGLLVLVSSPATYALRAFPVHARLNWTIVYGV
jgi:hypothetical protein